MSSDRACVSGAMLRVQAVTAARESLGRVNGAAVGADKRIVRILISLTPVHVANAFFFFPGLSQVTTAPCIKADASVHCVLFSQAEQALQACCSLFLSCWN